VPGNFIPFSDPEPANYWKACSASLAASVDELVAAAIGENAQLEFPDALTGASNVTEETDTPTSVFDFLKQIGETNVIDLSARRVA
jgi:hypothetical protein